MGNGWRKLLKIGNKPWLEQDIVLMVISLAYTILLGNDGHILSLY